LEKNLRYTLGKEDKLKSRKIIEQLFKEGKSFSYFLSELFIYFNQQLLLVNYKLVLALAQGTSKKP